MQENGNNKKIKLSHDTSNSLNTKKDAKECRENNSESIIKNKDNTNDSLIKEYDGDIKFESKINMDADEDLDYHQPLLVTGGKLRKYQIDGVNWLLVAIS